MKNSQFFFDYETEINDILQHHLRHYHYVGKPGNQYSVIQSIFFEINQKDELVNQYIRWYSVVLSLVQSYRYCRFQISLGNSSPIGGVVPKWIITWLELEKPYSQNNPAVIASIESYIITIARLGLLLSTKKKIDREYIIHKLRWIGTLLKKMLMDLEGENSGKQLEEVFVLTIKQATDNALKLESYLPAQMKVLSQSLPIKLYEKEILQKIKEFPQHEINKHFNLDNFWNGFIP